MEYKRNYGIDMLRCLSMLMIIILHMGTKGGLLITDYYQAMTSTQMVSYFWFIVSVCSVNCFAMISGYVGLGKRMQTKNILHLWMTVLFYSVLIYGFTYICVPGKVGIKDVIKGCLPVLTNQYWYFSAYVAVFFLAPAINFFVEHADKILLRYVVVAGFVAAVLDMFSGKDIFHFQLGYSVPWLIYLYLLGAYIKKFYSEERYREKFRKWCGWLFLVDIFGAYVASLVIEHVTFNLFGKIKGERFFNQYTAPTVIIAAVFLFLFMSSLELSENSIVVRIAMWCNKSVFSVYLLHNHRICAAIVFPALFASFLKLHPVVSFVAIPGGAILIFVVCILVDKLREWLFNAVGLVKLSNFLGKKLDGFIGI